MLFAVLSSNFTIALGHVASVLAIKIGALNLLTVRSRLITGDMASGKEGGVSQKADLEMSTACVAFFKLSLGAFGPTCSTQLVQLVNNAKENEPFFLVLAAAVAISGNPPGWGALGLYLYCACRLAHAFLFMFEFPKNALPYQVLVRAIPYLVSVFTMFSLAGTRFA